MTVDDTELVARSQKGDLDAFNMLVERHQAHVYNLALRMLGDSAAAEDVAQETFISAFGGIGRFRGGNLKAWLMRIAANAARDALRSRKSKGALSLDALELTPGSIPNSPLESPEDYALRRELGREIQKGLNGLSEDQRLAVVLVDIQGLDYEEAAQVIDASLGTLKSRLSRARANLRDYLMQRKELLPWFSRLDK